MSAENKEWTGETLEGLLQKYSTWPEVWSELKDMHNASLSGLKEASSDTTHVLQNALQAIRTLRIAVKAVIRRYELGATPEYGFEILQAAIRNTEAAEKLILSEHDGIQGAAPVTPKSWELVHDRVVRAHRQVIEELIGHLEHFGAYLLPPHLDAIASAKRIIADDPLNVDARPPVTPKSEEDVENEAPLASKASNETPQKTQI